MSINKNDRKDVITYRKALFFVGSLLVFCIANIAFFLILMQFVSDEEKSRIFITCIIATLAMLLPLVVYKFIGKRNVLVNIFSMVVYIGCYDSYAFSGGIYSIDLIWYVIVLPAWITMAANKKSGIFWLILSLIFTSFLLYAETNQWLNFKEMASKIPTGFILCNLFIAGTLTMSFMYVYETNNEKSKNEIISAKLHIEEKSKELELKNNDIVSSINYAQKIQFAVLPNDDTIQRNIPLSFIFFKPKDIVSGDFFWFHEINSDCYIIACADCTGHGVPGAFMTVIGSNLLSQIVIDHKMYSPSDILYELDNRLTHALKQEKEHYKIINDGMDISILYVNKQDKHFSLASAKRTSILFTNKKLQELKGSKNSIGGLKSIAKEFEEVNQHFNEGDMLYMFTDGYIDQFGGKDNKKFMIKRFRELLMSIHLLPLIDQRVQIENNFTTWTGKNEQTDDVLVIGIRF